MGLRKTTGKHAAWIDVMKGMGIILVVMGHVYGGMYGGGPVQKFIYAFHMPLFFFAAGYLYHDPLPGAYGPFLLKKLRTRVLPFFFLALLSYMLFLFRNAWINGVGIVPLLWSGDHKELLLQPALGVIVFANEYGLNLINTITLWFLPCLFVTENLFCAVRALSRRNATVLWVVLAALSAASYGKSRSAFAGLMLPWMLDTACMAVVFFGAGHAVREVLGRRGIDLEQVPRSRVLVVWLATMGIAILVSSLNSFTDMMINQYGNYPYFLLAALAGTISFAALSLLLAGQKWLVYLGMNTLIIFGLDSHLSPLADELMRALFGQSVTAKYFVQKDLHVLLITAWCFLVALPVIYLKNKLADDLAMSRQEAVVSGERTIA